MERYFVGIDNGGTNIKAAVFSSSGQQMSAASEQLPLQWCGKAITNGI